MAPCSKLERREPRAFLRLRPPRRPTKPGPENQLGSSDWLDDILVAPPLVIARWTWTGTNTGSLMGIPPTGRSASITGIHWMRFSGDRIAETWVAADTLGLMAQIGLVELPAPVAA